MRPQEDQVGVRGEEDAGDGCSMSYFCAAFCMAQLCTYFTVHESSSDGGYIWRGEVNFLRLILPLLFLLEFVWESLSLMSEYGFSAL